MSHFGDGKHDSESEQQGSGDVLIVTCSCWEGNIHVSPACILGLSWP
jgi:hypothetical protein